MSRIRLVPPRYPARPHSSGQARIKLNGETVYLGVWGTPASHAEYERRVAEWRAANGGQVGRAVRVRTVGQLLAAIWLWAEARYAGKPHLDNYRAALRPVHDLYVDAPIESFGPVALAACRSRMLETCCRNTANQRTRMIQFAWRQMVAAELIPLALSARLDTVSGIPMGDAGAVDYEAVGPVPEADLAATLPYLPPILQALVELQLLTGSRPGELVTLRPGDLHRGPRVELRKGHYLELAGCWARVFRGTGIPKRPSAQYQRNVSENSGSHKTARHGHTRVLLFSGRAQAILTPLLDGLDAGDAVFRTSAGTPYTTRTYCRAVARAVELASRARACERCRAARREAERDRRSAKAGVRRAPSWRPWETCDVCAAAAVGHWHPHQLRHSSATAVVEQFGHEVARLILGHKTLDMTRRYALDPLAQAIPALAGLEAAAVRMTSGNGDVA